MRIMTTLALLAAIVGGIATSAYAQRSCTTNCQNWGNSTTCQRTCF